MLRKNRNIIKKTSLYNQPIIYIRILHNKIMYIGESKSLILNRHLREDASAGDFDNVITIKASSDTIRRRYWEAYLIVKLKPSNQIPLRYRSLIHKTNTGSPPDKDYKESIRPKNIEELHALSRKNNIRGVLYWGEQIEQAKKHLKESQSAFSHFVSCYKKDKEDDKKDLTTS